MKKYLIVAAFATLFAWPIAQQATITAHPQANGVTCYSAGAALSCVHIPGVTSITPTWTPSPLPLSPSPSFSPSSSPSASPLPFTRTPTRTSTPGVTALPTRTPTSTPILQNLLFNPDFEQPGFVDWIRFDRWPELPLFNDERGHPDSRHNGAQSLRIFNESRCHLSGVYQRVSVTQFQTYVFSAWVRTFGSNSSTFPGPSDLSITDAGEVGIDPNGGIDPGATSVIWGRHEGTEQWRKISVQAVALSNRITVFIQARLGVAGGSACQWPIPFLIGFIDEARLEIAP